jgi:hypothetical protein
MKDEKRARRRGDDQRMKNRARRIMRLWFGRHSGAGLNPRAVGVNASTHCRPCGCWMCQAEGREVPQPRERPFHDPDTREVILLPRINFLYR